MATSGTLSPDAGRVPPLAPGTCQVWWARTGDVRPDHDGLLDPADRDRRARLARASDRLRTTASRVLTRLVLGAQLGRAPETLGFDRTCAFCGAPHGKPRLASGEGLHFSVSHSADLVALAVTRAGPVGVDVERVPSWGAADLAAVAELTLAPEERAVLARQPAAGRSRAFTTCWTRKEAAVKATGSGLAVPLAEVVVSPSSSAPRVLRWGSAGEPPALHALRCPAGAVGTLAVLGPGAGSVRVQEQDATALLRVTAAGGSRR